MLVGDGGVRTMEGEILRSDLSFTKRGICKLEVVLDVRSGFFYDRVTIPRTTIFAVKTRFQH